LALKIKNAGTLEQIVFSLMISTLNLILLNGTKGTDLALSGTDLVR
jgi:hypothetical protein